MEVVLHGGEIARFFLFELHLRDGARVQQPLDVAVQVAFESKGLKPGYHFIGSRVETRRFQALWVNWIQLVQPHLELKDLRRRILRRRGGASAQGCHSRVCHIGYMGHCLI
jgi:hypothetical protein